MSHSPQPSTNIRTQEHIGAFLRRLIDGFEITQDDLAEAAGCSRLTINQIINGHRTITADMALRLQSVTGWDAEDWMGWQNTVDLIAAKQVVGKVRVPAWLRR